MIPGRSGANMHNWIDFTRLAPSRRNLLAWLGGGATPPARPPAARAQGEPSVAAVLHDADNPVFGNPDGDVTIVEWFDFNCPYCRKIEPELRQVIQDDGKVRLVMKDWPILGP